MVYCEGRAKNLEQAMDSIIKMKSKGGRGRVSHEEKYRMKTQPDGGNTQ